MVNKQGVAWTVSEGHLFSSARQGKWSVYRQCQNWDCSAGTKSLLCFITLMNRWFPFLEESQIAIGHEHETETLHKHSAFKKSPWDNLKPWMFIWKSLMLVWKEDKRRLSFYSSPFLLKKRTIWGSEKWEVQQHFYGLFVGKHFAIFLFFPPPFSLLMLLILVRPIPDDLGEDWQGVSSMVLSIHK